MIRAYPDNLYPIMALVTIMPNAITLLHLIYYKLLDVDEVANDVDEVAMTCHL